MDYKKIYDRLIHRAKNRILFCYSERHHVLPKCMGGSDDYYNIAELTPEEHYIAHQLLVKIYPQNRSLIFALARMSNKSNKMYGWVRRRLSQEMKSNNPNKDGKSNRKRLGIKYKKYSWTDSGRESVRIKMTTRNPMKGIKPWKHPRATKHTIEMWRRASYYIDCFAIGYTPSQAAKHYKEKLCNTHKSIYKYWMKQWHPNKDEEWRKYFMQNLNEGDSVTLNTDSFDTNGKIGKIASIDQSRNRCSVVTEEGSVYFVSLDEVYKRSFLTES